MAFKQELSTAVAFMRDLQHSRLCRDVGYPELLAALQAIQGTTSRAGASPPEPDVVVQEPPAKRQVVVATGGPTRRESGGTPAAPPMPPPPAPPAKGKTPSPPPPRDPTAPKAPAKAYSIPTGEPLIRQPNLPPPPPQPISGAGGAPEHSPELRPSTEVGSLWDTLPEDIPPPEPEGDPEWAH